MKQQKMVYIVTLLKKSEKHFEACELVRVNCTGLNKSDCRKLGAKLKVGIFYCMITSFLVSFFCKSFLKSALQDLVPCIPLSFEDEHILMWRGKDWKSSLPQEEDSHTETEEVIASDATNTSSSVNDPLLNDQDITISGTGKSLNEELSVEVPTQSTLDDNMGTRIMW